MLRMSQSLPALGPTSRTFVQAVASSTPCSPLSTQTGAVSVKSGRSPKKLPQFNHTQFYSTPFDKAYEELHKARHLRKLEILFFEADTDGSGSMDFGEFREALQSSKFQRAFAALGVQPHQSHLVFKSLDKRRTGELSITEFMLGLTELVGSDIEGPGKELDIETLRPCYKAKQRHHSSVQRPIEPPGYPPVVSTEGHARKTSLDLGPVHLLPKVQIQRAFVHSASAQALHSATASRHKLNLTFPL